MKAAHVLTQYIKSMKDKEAALEYVHSEAEFIAGFEKSSNRHHFYGTYLGVEGVRKLLSKFENDLDTQEFEIIKIFGDDVSAFAWGRFKHLIRPTNKIFESYWAVICEIEGEKIKYFRGFEDTGGLEVAFRND